MNMDAYQKNFLNSLNHLGGLEVLFENLSNLSFFIKDHAGNFVMGNQSVARICGKSAPEQIVGHTDFDFFPKYIAERFRQDDLEVMSSGNRIIHRIEAISGVGGTLQWYATNKVPLYQKNGKVAGIAGITQSLNRSPVASSDHMEFAQVVAHIHENFSRPIAIQDLAKLASLSVSQFERRFKAVFQETPVQFILKLRVNEACKALIQTRQTISWIAQANGFCDQSYFTKIFYRRMGLTPKEYRLRHFQGQPLQDSFDLKL